jgi:hypothetical protein
MPHLNELYARFEEMDFKTRFQSIIHHPLNEMEFEAVWQMMLNDCSYTRTTPLPDYMRYAKIGYLHFSKETIVFLWSLHNETRA